jgi:nicotinate phosphoribosyltransferase
VIKAVGPQVHTMAFEIFVLAIVNELYFRRSDQAPLDGRAQAPAGED